MPSFGGAPKKKECSMMNVVFRIDKVLIIVCVIALAVAWWLWMEAIAMCSAPPPPCQIPVWVP